MTSHTGRHIYRCEPPKRNRAWTGGHVARQSGPVEDFIVKLVTGRLSRPDAADLLEVPEGGPDTRADLAPPARPKTLTGLTGG